MEQWDYYTRNQLAAIPFTYHGGDMKPIDIARKELGVHEIPGPESNARIDQYLATTGLSDDSTPWCSAFINWVMKKAGIKGTNDARAISWSKWGHEVEYEDAEPGDVVVLEWDSGSHHVAMFEGQDENRVHCIGGNQSDAVNERWYSKDDVINIRRA